MKSGEVWATRADGAVLVYDQDDKYGRALGHIKLRGKDYPQRPVIALMVRGGWTLQPITAAVVRTPAGAKKYGQPIGSVIVRDVVPRRAKGLVSDLATKIPGKKVRARYLEAGDVYVDSFSSQESRIISVDPDPEDPDYLFVVAVTTSGPSAGAVIHPEMAGDYQITYVRNDGERQDFDRDVIEPLKAKVAALEAKYPDGIAAALDQAVTGPPSEPPEMSPRLKELRDDPEIKMWIKAEASAHERVFYLEGQRLRGKATNKDVADAEERWRTWHYDKKGGKVQEYNVLLLNYGFKRAEWANRERAAKNVIQPHTAQAQEILADVRDIGQTARIGIEIELATRLPKPVYSGAGASSMAAFASLQQERDWQQAVWKMRRELAQRVVAETVGAATSTQQDWVSKKPKMNDQKYLRNLTPEEQAAMTAGLLRFPASWVEQFDRRQYTTSMAERGWHSEALHHIALSDFDGKGVSEDGTTTWATIVHEEGHGMEDAVPGLALLETVWWHDRMGELSPKKYYLADDAMFPEPDKPGAAGPKNIARPTAKSYSMKMYGNVYRRSETKFWEAFTTGVQEVLGDGHTDYTTKWGPDGFDADLWDVTMGALLTIDPSKGSE